MKKSRSRLVDSSGLANDNLQSRVKVKQFCDRVHWHFLYAAERSMKIVKQKLNHTPKQYQQQHG
jgi:hypothetical protein